MINSKQQPHISAAAINSNAAVLTNPLVKTASLTFLPISAKNMVNKMYEAEITAQGINAIFDRFFSLYYLCNLLNYPKSIYSVNIEK